MAITVRKPTAGGPATLQIAGRFDFSTHQEFTRAYKQFPKGEQGFVVDLKDASYMDSSAMGMLLQLREYSNKDGGVTLANAHHEIQDILRIANFDKLFKMA
jgi:HptB-dependent secretion and biofilm anti anti-sigma factor